MRKLLWALLLAVALAGAPPPDPVVWRIASTPAKPVKPGARFAVKLVARIQDGWHLYGMRPLPDGPVPTRIQLPEGQPFVLTGSIQAPEPQTLHDPGFNMEVELYEGEAAFTLPVRVAASTPAGFHKLVISASYQTCNNTICLPPKTVTVEAEMRVPARTK
jgi:DsbC/DsbD-like thiol-disulfide interchange protein